VSVRGSRWCSSASRSAHPGELVEVEVAASEHNADALVVQVRRVAAYRGVRTAPEELDDDLQHLPQLAHAADGVFRDREDVRDVALNGAEGACRGAPRRPSAIVCGVPLACSCPLCGERAASSAPAGSAPGTRRPGFSAAARHGAAAERPPPPTGQTSTSSCGTC
jgi:hypothetical protein